MRQLIDGRLMIRLLHLNDLAKASSAHIVVCPVLVSHLDTAVTQTLVPCTPWLLVRLQKHHPLLAQIVGN